jgi:hypothetical protein
MSSALLKLSPLTGRETVLSGLLGLRRVSHHLLLLTTLRTKVSFLRFPFDEIRDHTVRARDLVSSVVYERDGEELVSRGTFLELPAWAYRAFKLETE